MNNIFKIFFMCSFLVLSSCSFSKEKAEKETITSDALKQKSQSKLKNLVYLNLESALSQLQAVSTEELNAAWGNNENFLNYLVSFGSPELLDASLNSGLSVFLPNSIQTEVSDQLKMDLLKKYGSATVSIPESQNSVKAGVLQKHFNKVITEIYEEVRNDRVSKAQEVLYRSGGRCEPIMSGMLAKLQLDSSVPLSKITEFFSKVSCSVETMSIDEKMYFWKSEIQRQFKTKFDNLALLELLSRVGKMPYLISVSSSKFMAGLKSIINISRNCRVVSEENFVSSCEGNVKVEDLDTIVYSQLHFSEQPVDRYVEDGKYRDVMGVFTTDAMYPVDVSYSEISDSSTASDSEVETTEMDIHRFEQGIFRLFYGHKFDHKIINNNENVSSEVSEEESK